MASTTYTISKIDAKGNVTEALGSKSKKAPAVDLARSTRQSEKVGVRVETNAGTVVFELPAPKKIKMSKPYTRVVELPEGFEVPEGKRVAYTRNRKNAAILHDAEEQSYTVWDFSKGEELGTFETTRACGRFLADEVPLPAKA